MGIIMSRTCVFVDGGYLQKVLEKAFNRTPVDFSKIGQSLAKGHEPLLRTYYYNCLPYQPAKPSPEEALRFSKGEKFIYSLRQIPSFEVRLGRLEFRGIDQTTSRPIFEQKRVDVQLAVDILTLSFSRQIATAIVVAGDSDFIPAFEEAKKLGVRMVLAYNRINRAHQDLIMCADAHIQIDQPLIDAIRKG